MVTMQELLQKVLSLPPSDLKLIGEALAWYSPSQAETLKNAISFAQQELDSMEMREQQYEEASRMADMDCIQYGERV